LGEQLLVVTACRCQLRFGDWSCWRAASIQHCTRRCNTWYQHHASESIETRDFISDNWSSWQRTWRHR